MYDSLKEYIGVKCTFLFGGLEQATGILVSVDGKIAKLEYGNKKKHYYLVNMENVTYIQPEDAKLPRVEL